MSPAQPPPSLTTNEGDWPNLRWKPDLSPEAIFTKKKKIQAVEMRGPSLDKLLLRPAKKSRRNLWGNINSGGVTFRGGVKVLLNSLGNNLKYSMICTNWYEITHSA